MGNVGDMGSLAVTGNRNGDWSNPNTLARNNINARLGAKDSLMGKDVKDLTIDEIVNSILKKPAFGFAEYKPRNLVSNNLHPGPSNGLGKQKRTMFCEEVARAKTGIPEPTKYFKPIDWTANPETKPVKMFKAKRRTIAEEISHKAQWKEKTTPGPTGYEEYLAWKYTQPSPREGGTIRSKDPRTTFTAEREWYSA